MNTDLTLEQRCSIGIVPLGWPDPAADLPAFLDEVRDLGYTGVQFGPPAGDAGVIRRQFASAGVHVAERYFPIRCTSEGPEPGSLDEGLQHLDDLLSLGGEMLVAAVDGSPERDVAAGRADGAIPLSPRGWEGLADLVDELAARAEAAGARLSFHPHAGTYVETARETELLMEGTDPQRVGLCLDVGHWTVGGGDPVSAVDRYGGRITHVHLKDVDGAVLPRLRSGEVPGFDAAVAAYVFCPLGSGVLALDAVLSRLAAAGYRGWLMVEQDSFRGTASEVAAVSRSALARALAACD